MRAEFFLDFLDGFVARKLKTSSSLGIELDSLADLVSFGVAPVVVFYISVFDAKPTIFSFAACLWYLLAGAFRLARFNDRAQRGVASVGFEGLPITGASLLWVAVLFFLGQEKGNALYEDHETLLRRAAIFMFAALGFLMVSHLPYGSLKKGAPQPRSRRALRDLALLGILALLALLRFGPETLVLAVPLFYVFGTPMATIFRKIFPPKNQPLDPAGLHKP
jgi:CDP-diacylglycerol--serine O-phosphatidyltransferase